MHRLSCSSFHVPPCADPVMTGRLPPSWPACNLPHPHLLESLTLICFKPHYDVSGLTPSHAHPRTSCGWSCADDAPAALAHA